MNYVYGGNSFARKWEFFFLLCNSCAAVLPVPKGTRVIRTSAAACRRDAILLPPRRAWRAPSTDNGRRNERRRGPWPVQRSSLVRPLPASHRRPANKSNTSSALWLLSAGRPTSVVGAVVTDDVPTSASTPIQWSRSFRPRAPTSSATVSAGQCRRKFYFISLLGFVAGTFDS